MNASSEQLKVLCDVVLTNQSHYSDQCC